MKSYKKEFIEWAKGKTYILKVLEGCPLKAGDKVTFTNDYGVVFPGKEVMGIEDPKYTHEVFPSCKEIRVYIDDDSYWFSTRISHLKKEE